MQGKAHHVLVRLPNGHWTVRCETAGETFHPVVGPIEESRNLYVEQLGLEGLLSDRRGKGRPLVLWDVGLGAGANAIAALRFLHGIPGEVHLVSFDHSLEPLAFARRHQDRLEFARGYEPQLDDLLAHGAARFDAGGCRVHWEVVTGDFPGWLADRLGALAAGCTPSQPSPQAVLYDPFSPVRNPEMWHLDHFSRLRQVLDDPSGCRLATYSRSTRVRLTLLLAGFFVGIGRATGLKEETTVAATMPELLTRPLPGTWLERLRRSTVREPIRHPVGAGPDDGGEAEWWPELLRHRQFQTMREDMGAEWTGRGTATGEVS